MDLIKLAEDLGLQETDKYRYAIREHFYDDERIEGYSVHRYNKTNGVACMLTVSATMLSHITRKGNEAVKEDVLALWHKTFNQCECKTLCKIK